MARVPNHAKNKVPISVLDLAVLLFYVHRGAADNEVGFVDARESLETLTRELNKALYVDPTMLESAIWSSNIMDEQGKFWHPEGLTFDEWVRRIANGAKYNRVYGLFESKK